MPDVFTVFLNKDDDDDDERLKNAWVTQKRRQQKARQLSCFGRAGENGGRLTFRTLCEEETAEPLPKNYSDNRINTNRQMKN